MAKLYGYAGTFLRVDLTTGKITEEALDEKTARKWVGGTGFGTKILYDEVKAGVQWNDADNRFIIASGPLGGTSIGGSGTVSVVTKGPLSNGAVASQANGFLGAYMRFSGYDGIIFQGKAKDWVYLAIANGKAELRSAASLVGKDTWETGDLIKKEFGVSEHGMAVASIGPAGENLVKFASLFFEKGHTASHNGLGAVMGAKKLKAIAVARGKNVPEAVDKDRLLSIANDLHQTIIGNPATFTTYQYGTLNMIHDRSLAGDGIVPVKNYTTSIFATSKEKLETFWGPYIRAHFDPVPSPCWACRMHHCHIMKVTEGEYKGYEGEEPEYECFASFGPMIGNDDVNAAFVLSNECDKMGMDCNEMGWVLGMTIESYEKGVLKPSDTAGLDMKWGNYKAALEMIHRIAKRDGLGDILAEGVMRAAQKIGGEAPNFAIHTMKGDTPRGHDHRNRWAQILDTCVSQMSSDEGYSISNPADIGAGELKPTANLNYNNFDDLLKWNVVFKGGSQFEDCLGVCRFTCRTDLKLESQAVSAATGWDFTIDECMEVGRRIVNLLRAFNMRCGHTAEMDRPSPRYGSTPVDGPSKGFTIMTRWDEIQHGYYEGMGWDKATGKPLPETLKKFGLEYAIPELWGKK